MKATGKVLDSNGQPLEGVNIIIEGTTKGTTTNSFGNFSIDILPYNTLYFSHVGLKPVSRIITTELPLTIVLQEDEAYAFPEVVVSAPARKDTALWPWLLLLLGIGYAATRKSKKTKEVEL